MKNQIMRSVLALAAVSVLGAAIAVAQEPGGGRQGGGQRGGGGFQRGGFGPFGGNDMWLVMRPDVQKDLGITDEQKQKLGELRGNRRGGPGGPGGPGGQGGPGGGGGQRGGGGQGGGGGQRGGGGQGGGTFDPEQMRERMREMREQARKELAAILTPAQITRLDEISIQIRGTRAIVDPEVQTKLGMSDSQKSKIGDLLTAMGEANREIMEKVRNEEIDREEAMQSRENNNKILEQELAKVLTTSQASKLKELGGKPFAADPQFSGPGGGFGGGRGGPGGGGRGGRGGGGQPPLN